MSDGPDRDLADLGAQVLRLKAALQKYGTHFESCPQRPCACGFLEEWQAAGLPATFGEAALLEENSPAHRHQTMVDYLLLKVRERDWHGVSDAANDLRVMEARHAQ